MLYDLMRGESVSEGDQREAVLVLATPAEMTVVFDAGQNSVANFAHLDAAGLGFVGSVLLTATLSEDDGVTVTAAVRE